MEVGFTGSSERVTQAQEAGVRRVLRRNVGEFHHGDCIEGDAKAHAIALDLGCEVHLHPPTNPVKRAFCTGATIIHPPAEYLVRNRHIVDATQKLIACPKGPEETRSGTWSTVRYALKRGKPVCIIWPDGSIEIRGAPAGVA